MSMLLFDCQCGVKLVTDEARFPIHCRCGVVVDTSDDARISQAGEITRSRSAKPSPAMCAHRGHCIDVVECATCKAKVAIKVFTCNLHAKCTVAKQIGEIPCCATCDDNTATRRMRVEMTSVVGVITAPRKQPTLHRTLASLRAAGWDQVHVFDDGDSSGLAGATVRQPAIGAWGNWWLALSEMMLRQKADYYLLCEDDGLMATGARQYVESLDLLQDECVVSLYLSARYDYQQTTRFVGGNKYTGAVALLFTRSAAERLVSSGLGYQHAWSDTRPRDFIDGMIGEWCVQNNVPLWVHVPSLVQHIGVTSTLGHSEKPSRNVVTDVRDIVRTKRNETAVGLIGWNTPSGLGYMNRDIARHLGVASWLSPDHPSFPRESDIDGIQIITTPRPVAQGMYHNFLEDLDVLLFVETPAVLGRDDALVAAKRMGVRIVCVPMIEWLDDDVHRARYRSATNWPALVDLFLCPTRQCYKLMGDLQSRAVYCPWPLDIARMQYRQRQICERFVFVHGTGGCHDRKGALIVAEAARLAPDIPLTVWSQGRTGLRAGQYVDVDWPEHVDVRWSAADHVELYSVGDVCIQPSRLEGLGLQLLECQAAGLPLVTTDGDPMREYAPLRVIKSTQSVTRVHREITSYDADPVDLARIMRELHGQDISHASHLARQFAEQRSWGNSTVQQLLLSSVRRDDSPSIPEAALSGP